MAQEGIETRRAHIAMTWPSAIAAASNARDTNVKTRKKRVVEMRKADSAKSASFADSR